MIESRIADDKNCHFLLHIQPFISILVQEFSLGGDELTETKFSLVIVLTEQHAMDNNVETIFFILSEPQRLDDSLNRNSVSKDFRKNSVSRIVCLLKLYIQS